MLVAKAKEVVFEVGAESGDGVCGECGGRRLEGPCRVYFNAARLLTGENLKQENGNLVYNSE